MKNFLNIIHAFSTFLIGISGIGYSIFQYSIQTDLEDRLVFSIVAGLLSIVLIALGIERIQQKTQIEKEITKLFPILDDIKQQHIHNPYCEIIVSQEKIVDETISAMRKSQRTIRITNFKGQGAEDTHADYYQALGQLIKDKDLNYFCCYLSGQNFDNRVKGFKKTKLDNSHYGRMRYYEFTNPVYFNVFIYDNDTAIIGFPLILNEGKMRTAIKVRAISEQNKRLIESLILWFDMVLIPSGKEKNWHEIIS